MNGFFEPIAGIVRLGPDCHTFGDPFEYVVVVSGDEDTAILKALVSLGEPNPLPYMRATFRILRRAGFKSYRYIHDGETVEGKLGD